MNIFCSAQEFENLCRDIADKAETMRLQAKGGSMHSFIQSGDWVDVALCKGERNDFSKGDLILFRKDDGLYLHRVLKRTGDGFLVKGDMSFGHDGIIPSNDILARAVSVQRGRRRVDLNTKPQRFRAAIAADSSLVLQYPYLWARKISAFAMAILFRIQGLHVYRRTVRKVLAVPVTIRVAGPHDEDQLRDLYRMAGRDIREGLSRIKADGFWLVAECGCRIVAGLTISRSENNAALWVIFGLEVKPLLRGLGTGRSIVEEALLKAKAAGAERIGLLVNKRAKAALGLYRSLGFEAVNVFAQEFNRASDEIYMEHRFFASPILSVLMKGNPDWSSVLDSAVREGVFYPLYRSLTVADGHGTLIPADLAERFRQLYYLHISKSEQLLFQVERILDRIESGNIPVLLFKGAAIDSFIYDGYLRQRLDLDIAVRDGDMPALEKVLADLGYTQIQSDKDYPIPEYLNSRLFTTTSDSLIPVHVHRHLINNMFLTVDNTLSMDMEKVWEETERFKKFRNIFILNPECNIIFLCEHALKHDCDQLIFLYEIERSICCYRERLDWEKLITMAEAFRLSRAVYYGLYFVEETLSADIPKEVMERLKPARFTFGERKFIKNTLKKQHRRYASYPVYLAMRTGLLKKAYFMFRTLIPPGFTLKGYLMRLRRSILA
jgi:ribosomal protein S18 acetylase RimI-like enzyme